MTIDLTNNAWLSQRGILSTGHTNGEQGRIAVMQPYFLPYIGYFQLLHAVEEFVIFDDVQYIKRGWVNRNQVLLNGTAHRFTIPVHGASQTRNFNEVEFCGFDAFLRLIDSCYRAAPQFADVSELLRHIVAFPDRRVSAFVAHSLKSILEHLGLHRKIAFASELSIPKDVRGAERVVAICVGKGAATYVNPPGGTALYDETLFRNRGVDLRFVHPEVIWYHQSGNAFQSNLSILDVLMFNTRQRVLELLSQYSLVRACELP